MAEEIEPYPKSFRCVYACAVKLDFPTNQSRFNFLPRPRFN